MPVAKHAIGIAAAFWFVERVGDRGLTIDRSKVTDDRCEFAFAIIPKSRGVR
jgi:hypothetical protein